MKIVYIGSRSAGLKALLGSLPKDVKILVEDTITSGFYQVFRNDNVDLVLVDEGAVNGGTTLNHFLDRLEASKMPCSVLSLSNFRVNSILRSYDQRILKTFDRPLIPQLITALTV